MDDDGPGIPHSQRAYVLERFSRLEDSRPADRGGAGLGLAIVAGVAASPDGGVAVTNSSLGGARCRFGYRIDVVENRLIPGFPQSQKCARRVGAS